MLQVTRSHIYDEEISFFDHPFDVLKIEIGYSLIPIVTGRNKDGLPMLEKLKRLREEIYEEFGLSVPLIHVQDNMELRPDEYRILLRGVERGRYRYKNGHTLVIPNDKDCSKYIDTSWEKTKEPAFSMESYFVPEKQALKLKDKGFLVVNAATLISTHFKELLINNKTEILNQSMVSRLVNNVREKNADVVSDVFFNNSFSISNMKCLLNLLLQENVSIYDMETILETIADNIKELKKPYELVEKVREKLAFSIITKLTDEKKCVHVITLSEKLSDFLYKSTIEPESENDIPYICIEAPEKQKLLKKTAECGREMVEKGFTPIFLCVQAIRLGFSDFVREKMPGCICLSAQELKIVAKEIQVVVEEELSLNEE